MQIKSGADPRPKINGKHDRQINPFELGAESDKSEHLQPDQHDEKEKIEFVVLKHETGWNTARVPKNAVSPSVVMGSAARGISSKQYQ